ncbi:MAG: hypothetical protein ACXW11_00045 [Methylotenera sp.]
MTDDVELNTPTPRKWTTTLLDAGDGSDDAIINFPDDLLAFMGWAEGDILSLKITDNCIKLTKDNDKLQP